MPYLSACYNGVINNFEISLDILGRYFFLIYNKICMDGYHSHVVIANSLIIDIWNVLVKLAGYFTLFITIFSQLSTNLDITYAHTVIHV